MGFSAVYLLVHLTCTMHEGLLHALLRLDIV